MTETKASTAGQNAQPEASPKSADSPDKSAGVDEDLLRADIYQLLSRLLLEAPCEAQLDWLAGLESEADGSAMASAWQGLAEAAAIASPEGLERAHFRHLIGVIQGEITPYASWYLQGELMEAALVQLRHDLRLLGFERQPSSQDPEDHLAALCEVMAMLIGEGSSRQSAFFLRHLKPWAGHCFNDLARVDTPFYAALGVLGKTFMADEQWRHALEADQSKVRVLAEATSHRH